MSSQFGFLGFVLLQSLVTGIVLVALCDMIRRIFGLNDVLTFATAILTLGVIGYASFWIAFANYPLFAWLKIASLIALIAYFAVMIYLRRLAGYRWLGEPLLIAFLFFVVVVTLGFSNGGFNDPMDMARRRFGLVLPGDNTLPLIIADLLRTGRFALVDTDWLGSDRPPLQTGLYLFLTLKNHELAYQIVASWLQATFLFGVWALTKAVDLPAASRRIVMLGSCLLPVTIANTFYVWPKILPVGYLLLVFTLLFCRRPANAREIWITGILLGGLAALAVLSHGASAFALIGFAVVVFAAWRWPSWRTVASAAATLVLLYAPWVAYQRFIDPPGNRLLKWHLAGVVDVDSRTFWEALRDSYGALGWHDYVQGRLVNLAVMIGDWPGHLWNLVRLTFDHDPVVAQAVLRSDFFELLPSLHVFSLALIAAVVLLPFTADTPARRTAVFLLASFGAVAASVGVLIFIPGQTINHVNGYVLQVSAVMVALIVLSLRAPAVALGVIALQSITVMTAYGFIVGHNRQFWAVGAVCIAATVALYAYALAPTVFGRDSAAGEK